MQRGWKRVGWVWQGGLLPRLRLVQQRPGTAHGATCDSPASHSLEPPHHRAMTRGEAKEEHMTPTELILLLNALANLIAALAQLLAVWRSP